MELPNIGQRCADKTCQQLDFLPLKCKCGQLFCSEHFNLHTKTCQTFIDLQVDELKMIKDLHKCSEPGCAETNLVPIICPRCKQNFCIKHRHLTQCKEKTADELASEKEKYEAPVRQFNLAKHAVDQQIEKNLNAARKKGKNPDLVNKVQLMKIKNKAVGLKTIPISDRIYFNVFHNDKSTPVFVSKMWSVGRCIDAIADECQLQNNNNKTNAKQLRLFAKRNNEILTNDLSENIQKLLEKQVCVDGENLLIEYVNN